jgi:hypothetical protein
VCNSASVSGSKASISALQNAGMRPIASAGDSASAFQSEYFQKLVLNCLFSHLPAHTFLLFSDSQANCSALKNFAADTFDACSRVATEVTAAASRACLHACFCTRVNPLFF